MIAHYLGRPVEPFQTPYTGSDTTFVAQRLDDTRMSNGSFRHCTFINMSFKDATLNAFDFLNCIFINCYFRRTTLKNCTIVGCQFHDCDFPKLNLVACSFRYTRFRRCQIAFASIRTSLPEEPNLCRDICRNLALQSSKLGLRGDARRYRMEELASRERHLRNAVLGESQWYKSHYTGFAKFRAFFDLSVSLINKYLFGYGESLYVLVRNSLIAAFLIFPTIYYFSSIGFAHQGNDALSYVDFILFSISTILPMADLSSIETTRWFTHTIAGLEAICGVVVLAFIAAYVFRWSIRQ
ncbi:MAG: pentapeptide repeat-containing protein [Gammaproteobacteria bacterium]|nr:pentapeptide repeat-containing protein [Gammaproteobacteria bacterium]MYC52320.1 pentapeptide repeat-containing protein [Gammaproteobacteria bacterium]